MKKVAYIILLAGLLGCDKSNVEKKDTAFVVREGLGNLTLITVDSCEYFLGEWGNATVLTHKGNCKHCKQKK
jgi:hypothetical protein